MRTTGDKPLRSTAPDRSSGAAFYASGWLHIRSVYAVNGLYIMQKTPRLCVYVCKIAHIVCSHNRIPYVVCQLFAKHTFHE